jgi:hypothetical protein
MKWYRWDGQNLALNLLVQPKASKDEFVAIHGNAYKVRITAPPLDGRANAHLIKFLAKAFDVNISHVKIISGYNSRHKTVNIQSPTLLPISIPSPFSN